MKRFCFSLLILLATTVGTFIVFPGWTVPEHGIYSVAFSAWMNQMIDILERIEER